MNDEEQKFDRASHDRLLDTLAQSQYIELYLKLCAKYKVQRDANYGPRLDVAATAGIFRSHGVSLEWNKRFKVFTFDREEVSGWIWQAKLVLQRYDSLEPMLEGFTETHCVGSTWLSLALHAADRRVPPTPRTNFLPPAIVVNRPQFDGDMRTMERMVPDLISLFRHVKDLVRHGWSNQGKAVLDASGTDVV